jgi:hypothetical protein
MILFPFSLQDPIAATALFWARALCVQAWSESGKSRSLVLFLARRRNKFHFCFAKKKLENMESSGCGAELVCFLQERKKETLSGWSHEDNKSFQSLSLT